MKKVNRDNNGLLDVMFMAFVVLFIGVAMFVSVNTVRSLADNRTGVDYTDRLPGIAVAGTPSDKTFDRAGRTSVKDPETSIESKRKELAWLEVELDRKEVSLTYISEEIEDLNRKLVDLKSEMVRAHLYKMMSGILDEIAARESGAGQLQDKPFDVRNYALETCRAARAMCEEGSTQCLAMDLFEKFVTTNLTDTPSAWNDIVGIMDWYSSRAGMIEALPGNGGRS